MHARAQDLTRAVRNAAQLFLSLCGTWGVALAVRVVLPRSLGPSRFGELNFADAFAATAFVAVSLGVDTYVRKEVSVKSEHASDFWGGVLAVRLAATVALLGAMWAVLRLMHRPPEVQALVLAFAVAQIFVAANATLSALLHAAGNVSAMSVLAVVTKLVWAAGIAACVGWHLPIWCFGAAFGLSEAIETVALWALARRHLALRTRFHWKQTRAVLLASLPFFLNAAAHGAYARLDVTLLAFAAPDREVGWYGAAAGLAGLALLLTPLIGWVLMPLLARAWARSREELYELLRRSIETTLLLALPAALALALGADFWVRLVFGEAFAPAALALRLLAPMFVLTYLAIISGTALNLMDRGWSVTAVSLAALALNPIFNLLLIGPGLRIMGAGGGGAGCALAMLATELFATSALLALLGRGAFDKRSLSTIAKCIIACLVTAAADRSLARFGAGRLAIDAALYCAVVVGTGAVRVGDLSLLVRSALRRGQPAAA